MNYGVLFDMDGVLVDSEPAITYAAQEVLRRLGCETDPSEFKPFTGMGDDKFIGGVLESHGGVYQPSYKEEAYAIYRETAAERVRVYPWSRAILTALSEQGFRLAVASASDLTKVSCNLSCIGVELSLFGAVVTGSDVTRKKPAPDLFQKAAERLMLPPERCFVVEDALSGVQAAKAAGMTAIAVTTSFPAEALLRAGADRVTDDLSELPRLIGELIAPAR